MTDSNVDELRLQGRNALVTGAGSGIGSEIARLLAARGARVCVNDLNTEGAEAVAEEIHSAGGTATVAAGDVAESRSANGIIGAAVKEFQSIHILVNNAGIGGTGRYLEQLEEREWTDMLRVNLGSVFLMTRLALSHVPRDGFGRIINISSMYGISGAAGSTHYAAAKAGVIGFTKALARELAPQRITVNAVAPGMIDTPMLRARGTTPGPPWLLWPRVGTPDDIAQTVAFLSSRGAEFITGQVISPNGGGVI